MNALLRKEFQLESDVIIGTSVLLIASFPLALMGIYMQGIKPFPWVSAFAGACILNQYTLVLTGALLGAVAFAREREDGNVHFLAFLPISLFRQYTTKVVAGLTMWIVLWTLNAILMVGVTLSIGEGIGPLLPFLPRMFGTAAFSFAALGFASLAGCYISSATGAAFAGLTVLMSMVVARLLATRLVENSEYLNPLFVVFLATLGIAAFILTGIVFGRNGTAVPRFAPSLNSSKGLTLSSMPREFSSVTAVLIWKDFRLLRTSILIGMLLIFLPFSAAGGNALFSGSAAPGFRLASIVAIMLGWVVIPWWSASSLANDWATSSDRFLAYLPVSTLRIVLSKFVAAVVPTTFVILCCTASFIVAEKLIDPDSALYFTMPWDEFNQSDFLSGAVAYLCALPVTFAITWFFAARLRRKIVAIVLGILSGPLAMATWAVTTLPDGYVTAHLLPAEAIALHVSVLATLCTLLVISGAFRIRQHAKSQFA